MSEATLGSMHEHPHEQDNRGQYAQASTVRVLAALDFLSSPHVHRDWCKGLVSRLGAMLRRNRDMGRRSATGAMMLTGRKLAESTSCSPHGAHGARAHIRDGTGGLRSSYLHMPATACPSHHTHTLSFVDVRYIGYNKNPDNNNVWYPVAVARSP
jgi:hypothetical protein